MPPRRNVRARADRNLLELMIDPMMGWIDAAGFPCRLEQLEAAGRAWQLYGTSRWCRRLSFVGCQARMAGLKKYVERCRDAAAISASEAVSRPPPRNEKDETRRVHFWLIVGLMSRARFQIESPFSGPFKIGSSMPFAQKLSRRPRCSVDDPTSRHRWTRGDRFVPA